MAPLPLFLRALLAFLAVPAVTVFAVPLLLLRPPDAGFNAVALVTIVPGVALLLWSIREFYVAGRGTLAPWSPPTRLVTSGPYGYSRNPMYVGVMLVLIGWAIAFRSRKLLFYAVVLLVVFAVFVRFYEEPFNARRHREEWRGYKTRVPRWIFPSRRAVALAWAALLVALPVGGLIYEAVADGLAQRAFPPPGMLVDIGGRRLHLVCTGSGEPVVVFVHGEWGHALSSSRARERIAARTTACSYDRSGHGWSDPGPELASAGAMARDLAVLQDRAPLPWPLVLVGPSIGGTTEMFARQYPERVAGLVMLDAVNGEAVADRSRQIANVPSVCGTALAAHFGVVRLLDPFAIGWNTDEARRESALTYNPRVWDQQCAVHRGLTATVEEFVAAPPLRSDVRLTAGGSTPDEVTEAVFALLDEIR